MNPNSDYTQRTTIALTQLHRLLQQATDILANLHSLYLLHTGQVDAHFQRSFPPLPPPPSFTVPIPSPTSSCDSAPIEPIKRAPRKPTASQDSSSSTPPPQPPQPRKRRALHGHQLHRAIQPTQWSRRVGIAGLPTFDVFPWLLAYQGTADYTARTLSHGKYCGLIPTRSIAESVFTTHLLQEIRDRRFASQGSAIPNKTTQARAFHAPLITLITQQLQAHAPAAH